MGQDDPRAWQRTLTEGSCGEHWASFHQDTCHFALKTGGEEAHSGPELLLGDAGFWDFQGTLTESLGDSREPVSGQGRGTE